MRRTVPWGCCRSNTWSVTWPNFFPRRSSTFPRNQRCSTRGRSMAAERGPALVFLSPCDKRPTLGDWLSLGDTPPGSVLAHRLQLLSFLHHYASSAPLLSRHGGHR